MNVSIISTYVKNENKPFNSRRFTKVLLELAEIHLNSPETSHLISREGVEKVRDKVRTTSY